MLQRTRACAMPARSTRRCLQLALLVVTVLLLLPANVALAAPVAPDEVVLTQPDGTVIVAAPFGDEWYSGYEHEGRTILLDRAGKYWVYARQEPDGRLSPGPWQAGIDKPPLDLTRSLRDKAAIEQAKLQRVERQSVRPAVWPGSLGSGKVLIILMDFTPSTARGTSDAQWYADFFDNTPGAKTVKNWYEQASYGNFTMVPVPETYGAVNDGVVAVTLPYANPYPWSGDEERTAVRDTLIATNPFVNFAALDTNGNGSLDNTELHLVIIARGYEESYGGTGSACTPNVWGHRTAMQTGSCAYCAPVLDGVTVGASVYNGGYTLEGEWHARISDGCTSTPPGHRATIGIMVHELGHDIDWPDTYDTDYTSQGVGNWCIMSGGSWGRASGDSYSGQTPVLPNPFHKWYQRWLTPVQLAAPQAGVALPNSAQNAVAYILGANPGGVDWDFYNASGTGEYFLVENRQQVGFDAGLYRISSSATGCMIWHVDETRTSSNSANANETRRLVDVEEADGPPQDMDLASGSGGNSGDSGDPWPGSTSETAFGAGSDPNSNWYDGSASGIAVTNISTAGAGCTVDFSALGPTWNGSVGANWDATNNWTVGRLPNRNDVTIIPAGAPNWPNVNASASAFNLNILNGAHMNASAGVSLDVYGDWTEQGSGYFDGSAGTVTFRGTQPQSVTTGAGSHFYDLQIGSGSTTQTVTAGSDLDVNGNLSVGLGAKLAAGSHTIHVAGNWTDNPFGFAPGTGTVIMDGAAQTVQRAASEVVVYSNDLSNMAGWATLDANSDSITWYYGNYTTCPNSPDHGANARYQRNSNGTTPGNDWLISAGFALQAGATYDIRFNYGGCGPAYTEKLAVHIGTAQTVAAMTTQVFNNSSITWNGWQPGSGAFTPSSSGTYYLGFYAYSAANQLRVGFDDVVVTAPDPNLAFYNLSVAGSSTATLGDNAVVQNNLSVAAGSALSLDTYGLSVEGTVTNNGALAQTKTVNAASTSFLNLKNGAGSMDKYLGVTIDPGSSTMGSTTVTIRGNQLCTGATNGVRRCFELDPGTTQSAAVTFYYTEAERNGADNPSMLVYHWNGSDWELEGGTSTRGGSNNGQWVRVTGVDAYSPFALNSSTPTAVTLAGLDGRGMADGSVLLTWQTVSDVDLLGFHVYRAAAETDTRLRLNKELIPSQQPGSQAGGSYSYQDWSAPAGASYYWLELLEMDGTEGEYGPVRVVVRPASVLVIHLPVVISGK